MMSGDTTEDDNEDCKNKAVDDDPPLLTMNGGHRTPVEEEKRRGRGSANSKGGGSPRRGGGGGGDSRQHRRGRGGRGCDPFLSSSSTAARTPLPPPPIVGRILVLHGNRQTGELLLSRMDKLRKKLLLQPHHHVGGLQSAHSSTTTGRGRRTTPTAAAAAAAAAAADTGDDYCQEQGGGYELVAIDAPHNAAHDHPDEDPHVRTWWTTRESCEGLDETLKLLCDVWEKGLSPPSRRRKSSGSSTLEDPKDDADSKTSPASSSVPYCGVLGFSQGARLAHLMALLHEHGAAHDDNDNIDEEAKWFPGLKFVVLVAGYDAPLPDNVRSLLRVPIDDDNSPQPVIGLPSLHVWGEADKLITPSQSRELANRYVDPTSHVHEGGHHVPMRAADVRAYLEFVHQRHGRPQRPASTAEPAPPSHSATTLSERAELASSSETLTTAATTIIPKSNASAESDVKVAPDEDNLQAQLDELEAIEAIYPDEFRLMMRSRPTLGNANDFPIKYEVDLIPTTDLNDEGDDGCGWWPPKPLALRVTYPPNYPLEVGPVLQLVHANNVMELTSLQSDQCQQEMQVAAQMELGMGCVLSCILAAREYFESGKAKRAFMSTSVGTEATSRDDEPDMMNGPSEDESQARINGGTSPNIKPSSRARINECNLQGLDIAESILKGRHRDAGQPAAGKGGSWTYTIGLVGKPSAGKSTFFNVATAFARQRDDKANALGGATMAPHPFTTIDPNVGYCLVPAPEGSCPEDGLLPGDTTLRIGSTHGRDPRGRRLLPVLLKDVAGLVPGAYQGRGRGNKFLNDLTDANVLIHVLDGSGTADEQGNALGMEKDGTATGASDPLQDLAWIRNELIEWVYSNVVYKWDAIRAKGQERLAKMFSGYGQPQAVTLDVLSEVEKYLDSQEGRDRALSNLYDWDEGDLHRVVSAFLGVRFPMALAINKCDIATSKKYVEDIISALPIHGAHVGVPMCAKSEMHFVRNSIYNAMGSPRFNLGEEGQRGNPPNAVWRCLQEAVELKEPVLVFPVADFTTYASLPGLIRYATEDASLPSAGMVACIHESGGSAPSLWDESQRSYAPLSKNAGVRNATALRDVLVMKPGSTVDDCYVTLKRLGAVAGDFVRAEATGDIGSAPKQVPKNQVITRNLRILKVMTTKKASWQK